jgi:2-keto-4-pentenoate hydratase/2-oxohepta-3-ene-1,7-dioic acid hydratase in catechol pathway
VSDFIEFGKIPNPDNVQLDLQVTRNGSAKVEKFGFNTGEMIWSVKEQIAFLSRRMVLNPGDIILSGSCIPPQILDGDRASF